MNQGRRYLLTCGFAHGRVPYPVPSPQARRRGPALGLLALLLFLAAPPAQAAPRTREIRADGKWSSFELKVPEEVLIYLFEMTSGCRYRLTVQCRTLPRVLVEIGLNEAALHSGDSKPPPDLPPPGPPPDKPEVVVTWDAEVDGVLEARIRGFSAMTGKGRVRLETLGPDDERVRPHRRMLAPGGMLAKVGSLWVGEPNRWELIVRPGHTYEVRSRPGTAGRIALAVVGPDDLHVASAPPSESLPYPTLRFEVPEPAEGEAPMPLWLQVSSVDGSGGTYGVRLVVDPPRPREPGIDSVPADATPTAQPSGPVPGAHLTFHANPGDLAVLFLPYSYPYNPHLLQRKTSEGKWKTLPHDRVALCGERASMRTPEKAALLWFRPFRAGVYRFREPRSKDAVLRLYPAAEVPAAPALLGTGVDPRVSAHGGTRWRTIGLAVCMPGWDYLFVAVGRRRAAVSMRAVEVGEETKALRVKRGLGPTRAPGLGPSYRFRVTAPTLIRLEVRGKKWIGYAMLGRASS